VSGNIRNLSAAFTMGAAAALVFDLALRNALAASESPGASSMTPWWVVGRLFERGVWVLAAFMLWVLATPLARVTRRLWPAGWVVSRSAALEVVGRLMIAIPACWLIATWATVALRIAFAGSWEFEGRIFWSVSYYTNVLLGYVPWAAGGVSLLALSRHAPD
jgi:hypothetical protein